MQLIVSRRQPLIDTYGEDGFDEITGALDRYSDCLGDVDADHALVFLDDQAMMDNYGTGPIAGLGWEEIAQAIRAIGAATRVTSVLIVGGTETIPFCQFSNPAYRDGVDPDRVVYSDNPYGVLQVVNNLSYYVPQIPVGRLLQTDLASASGLVDVIESVIDNHLRRPARGGACAIVNKEWSDDSRRVAEQLPADHDWRLAPGYEVTPNRRVDLDRDLLYFNLHGFDDDAAWKAYDDAAGFIPVLEPGALSAEYISGTTVFAENCYGAHVVGKTPQNSCAMKCVGEGVASFIGATGIAYGSYIAPGFQLEFSDELAAFFFELRGEGYSAGVSFKEARADYFKDNTQDGEWSTWEQKTALQFVLFGDPLL